MAGQAVTGRRASVAGPRHAGLEHSGRSERSGRSGRATHPGPFGQRGHLGGAIRLCAALGLACCAWLAQATPTVPAWGQALGVQHCPSQEPEAALVLSDALVRALCNSPEARASWAVLQVAAVERDGLRGIRPPEADLVAGVGRSRAADWTTGEEAEARRGPGSELRLSAQWVLFDFGLRQAQQQAAAAALLGAQASHDEAVQQVMLAAVQAYLGLAQAEGALALARSSERVVRDLLTLALRPKGPGASALEKVDELQARSALAERGLDLRRAQARVARARGELAVLLGLPPDTQLNLPRQLSLQPPDDFEPGLAGHMAEAQRRHPGLQAARARVVEAQHALVEAGRSGRPTVRAVGDWQRSREPLAAQRRDARVGVQLEIPLFTRADRQRREQRARAELSRSEAQLRGAERDQSLAVWTQYQTLREELAALRLGDRWLQQAEALLAAEVKAFQTGDADMFDVLDANDGVLAARSSLLDSQVAFTLQRYLLAVSIGRLPWPGMLP